MDLSMELEERTRFKRFDTNFALLIIALNIIGLINLYSATHGPQALGLSRLFIQQIIWLVGGWTLYILFTFVDYQLFQRLAYVFYGLNVFFLVLVDLIGKTALGAQRWLDLGFFRYQPSETMKMVMIMVLARHLSNIDTSKGLGWRELFVPAVLLALPFGLTVVQPDLGTAMMLFFISLTMLAFVGIRRQIWISAILVAMIAAPVVWNFGLKEYQKDRIFTFLDPGRDPRGAGYNSIQSKIAVGSGKFFGKGFRQGTQAQLEFLPERHTDFIYSVLSEEHGFVGSLTTIGLYVTLLILGVGIASQARDRFGALMAIGVLAYCFWHMCINIGMVIGLLPIVGIPLPLLSYGGSGMLTTMVGLGIVSGVSFRRFIF